MTRVTGIDALRMWERIARGELDDATSAWLRDTARRLVSEVFKGEFTPSSRRANACLKAVGFSGSLGTPELAELAQSHDALGHRYSAAFIAEAADLIIDIKGTPKQIKRKVETARRKAKR